MILPSAADGAVCAAIRVCESINFVFINDLDDRAAALSEVIERVDKIRGFLSRVPRSFHVAHVSSQGEVLLDDILSALVQVENDLQRVGSMSMFAYRMNRDAGKGFCRINLDDVDWFISALKRCISYQNIAGANTEAKVETAVGQEKPHYLQSNVTRNLDKLSEPTISDFRQHQEKILNASSWKPSTTKIQYNETFLHDEVELIDRELGDMEVHDVAKSLMGYRTRATRLLLDKNRIGHDGVAAIAAALAFNSRLQELALDINNIRDKGAMAIAESLKTNTTLQFLSLSKNNIGDEGAKAIAEALKSNLTLQYLSLEKNHICNAGAKAIAEALREKNSALRQLWLSHNKIADEGAIALAGALKYESKSILQNLSIQHNLIRDEGAEAIADALKSNNTLQILGLRNKYIRYTGAMAIANALKYNSTLQNLYIESFPNVCISQKVIDEIHRIMSKENRDGRTRNPVTKPKKLD